MKCLHCNKETSNPKYCSKSCSAKANNVLFPKKIKTNSCKGCKISITSSRTYCDLCWTTRPTYSTLRDKPLSQVRGERRYQKSSYIREHSRSVFLKNNPNPKCYNCAYDKHIEVCHIKAISSFEDSTLISEINSISNLVGLCPNCHWEFDHGILQLTFT